MIIDHIQEKDNYRSLSPDIARILDFLAVTDFTKMEAGSYTIEESDYIYFVKEFASGGMDSEDCPWEGHHNHIDVHYIVNGTEKFGYASINNMRELSYDDSTDFAVYEGYGDFFTMTPGMFAIVEPQDIHMPAIKANDAFQLKRIVVKVKLG